METILASLDRNMFIAAAVLLMSYIVIFSEIIHRTSAAIIGAVTIIILGMVFGFYSQESAMKAIDANTLLLLAGMMMVVAMLRPTGIFQYIAIRLAKMSHKKPRLLLFYISLVVTLISMVLDNVTTVIIFAPITVLITRMLNLNPMPYLMAEAILSNIGGASTLVGDPPNIMIGSAAGINFSSFLLHMAPPVFLAWICTIALLFLLFHRQLSEPFGGRIDLDEKRAIKDAKTLLKGLIAVLIIVLLFFIHHRIHIYPAFATFIGLAFALMLIQPKPEKLFGEVNWSVLIFFAGLFVIVGGVEESGLLQIIGKELAHMAVQPQMLLKAALLLMWVSALLSAVVDNIPFTVTMIPIIHGLDDNGINIAPLWWALAIGVGLGGNGTHVGATANIIVVVESEECGMESAKITPVQWMRIGLPAMFASLVVTSLAFVVFFEFFL
ncbi:MAG: ArsB/NhaD family transporter [Deltaproteobacteria bacterium]|nr:ArsB/NhaD family transporter [Deltaproteobacteria bacterium]